VAIRLRQVVLVAPDLGPALEELRDGLGIEPCFHDPGVAQFGLENVLFPIGEQFLEIVAPVEDGTAAGRHLERRGGAGGYMLLLQCDDLDRRRARLTEVGVRTVWQADLDDIKGTHLHPRDLGGTIVSLDEATPWDSWRWAGPSWQDHVRTGVVQSVTGAVVEADHPPGMARRWAEVLELPQADDTTIRTDDATLRFAPAGGRGEGLAEVEVVAADRARAGDVLDLCGVRFRFA
jgi:hypothetical protein